MKGFALLAVALALEGAFFYSIATPPAPATVAHRDAASASGDDEPEVTVFLPEIVVRVPPREVAPAELHARVPAPLAPHREAGTAAAPALRLPEAAPASAESTCRDALTRRGWGG